MSKNGKKSPSPIVNSVLKDKLETLVLLGIMAGLILIAAGLTAAIVGQLIPSGRIAEMNLLKTAYFMSMTGAVMMLICVIVGHLISKR